jgi:predicted RNA binding protein YcfA (HicA-like mRNA interferase family)
MSRTPRVTGAELIGALAKAGFSVLRVKGSHHFLRHQDGRSTVVPAHSGETTGIGLLHKILRDCRLTADELVDCSKNDEVATKRPWLKQSIDRFVVISYMRSVRIAPGR